MIDLSFQSLMRISPSYLKKEIVSTEGKFIFDFSKRSDRNHYSDNGSESSNFARLVSCSSSMFSLSS